MLVRTGTVGRLQKAGTAVFLFLLSGAIFVYPTAAATGASRGLSLCGAVIIPSLLPFLVLTGTFLRSALNETAGRLLEKPTAFLFRLPGCCGAAILLSLIGGYPAGAAAVRELLERRQITAAEGTRLLHFCVNAGPAFAVSAVGAGMLGNVHYGWLLLAAGWAAALLIGIAEARFCAPAAKEAARFAPPQPLAVAFTAAVNSACVSLLYMCGFVVLFAVLLSLADASGVTAWFDRICALPALLSGGYLSPATPSLLPGLLEVSSGCLEVADSAALLPFPLGFFLGFGGLSVQCQVRAILAEYPACCRRFFGFRVLHGLLGGCLSALLFRVVPLPATTLAGGTAQLRLFSASPGVSLAMLGMCVAFLLQKRIDKTA